MVCKDCDLWKMFNKECWYYFKGKNWCTQRMVNNIKEPILKEKEEIYKKKE